MRLGCPLPPGVKIIRMSEAGTTLLVSLPTEVVDLWAQVLEIASRLTGSDRMGMLISAMSQECMSSWAPLLALQMQQRGELTAFLNQDTNGDEHAEARRSG